MIPTAPSSPALIIVPTFNEADNIPRLIRDITRVVRHEVQVLVVDDNSPDGTGRIVSEIARDNPRVTLLARPEREGYARAYLSGFTYALKHCHPVVICMDADLSHDPRYLDPFLDAIETVDCVVGSRYTAGGGVEDWGWFRRSLSRWGNRYARAILGAPLHDMTSGFRCFRTPLLPKIGYERIRSNGYEFNIEMNYRLFRTGCTMREIPIRFPDRTKGKSKLSKMIIFNALVKVWKLRFAA